VIPLHAFDHGPPTGVRLGIAAVAGLLATLVMTLVMWAQRYGYVPPYVAAAALWRRPPNEVSRPAADAAHLAAGVLAGVVYEAANVAYESAGESLGLGDVHFGSVTSLSEMAFLAALVAFSAIENNDRVTKAWMGMGEIYRQRDDYRKAARRYERVTELEPNNARARYYFGRMQQMLGDVQESVEAYLQTLTLSPEDGPANRALAAAYLQLDQPGQALPYAEAATELQPEQQQAWATLASAYSRTDRYEHAVDAYRRALDAGEPTGSLYSAAARVVLWTPESASTRRRSSTTQLTSGRTTRCSSVDTRSRRTWSSPSPSCAATAARTSPSA